MKNVYFVIVNRQKDRFLHYCMNICGKCTYHPSQDMTHGVVMHKENGLIGVCKIEKCLYLKAQSKPIHIKEINVMASTRTLIDIE